MGRNVAGVLVGGCGAVSVGSTVMSMVRRWWCMLDTRDNLLSCSQSTLTFLFFLPITFPFQPSGQAVVTGYAWDMTLKKRRLTFSPPGINMPSFLSHREFSITTSRGFPANLANSRSSAFRDEAKAGQALRWVFWNPPGFKPRPS